MRVAVIGLGAMGVAAARVLAGRGHEVIGIDKSGVAHEHGATAHDVRAFHLSHAAAEDVRLARRSLRLWRELERRDGTTLLRATGLLEIGGPHDAAMATLRSEGATVVELDGADVGELFGGLRSRPGLPARFTPAAGVLAARDCLLVQAEIAARDGAEIRADEALVCIERREGSARLVTTRRTFEVDVAVVAAGSFTADLTAPLGLILPLAPELAQTTVYDGPQAALAPCLIEWDAASDPLLTGIPVAGRGYRLGLAQTAPFDPRGDDRRVDHGQVLTLSRIVAEGFDGLEPQPLATERRTLTSTPDGGLLLDRRGPIVVGAGGSGSAFALSPAIGELLADLVEGATPLPRFALDRPALAARSTAA